MIVLYQFVHDTLHAIALLHKEDRITQALILLYSAIDTLAWLDTDQPKTTRTAFCRWVDQYLLPESGLGCTSSDLYSARCGLLHTHTAESRSTGSGEARQIWYWTGEKSRRLLEYQARGRTDVVFLRVVDLLEAFVEATESFADDLGQDAARAKSAEEKTRRWLAWVPAPPTV